MRHHHHHQQHHPKPPKQQVLLLLLLLLQFLASCTCRAFPVCLFLFRFLAFFPLFFARSQTRSTESLTAKWVHCGIFYLPPSLSSPLPPSLSVCVLHLCFPLAAFYSVLPPKLNANNARRRKSCRCRCHSAHCATLRYTTLHTQCVLVPGERISHCPR